jgi:hypothetical protein
METLLGILGMVFSAVAVGCTIWLAVVAARVAWWWCLLVIFGCGIGTIVFAVMHWDRAKRPFLIGLVAGILGGACSGVASGMAMKSAMEDGTLKTAEGESVLPAFEKELAEARKAAEAGGNSTAAGDAAAQAKPAVAVAPEPAAEPLPFTPTARPKPFPYKDAPAVRTATAAAAPAGGESVVEAASAGQVPVPAEAPPAPPKPKIEVASATLAREDGSGTIQIEINNAAPKAITEVKLSVTYLDTRGVRIGTWTTTRRGDPRLAPASGSGKFTELAIRMPSAARKVDVQVVGATLEDGTQIEY